MTTPQTNTEVAGCLLDGVTADIWTDAHECTDQIAQTQDAMAEAAHRLGQMDELVAKERAARIAAQTENEVLKGWLAHAGVEHRRDVRTAVLTEREACAEVADDADHVVDVPGYYAQLGDAKATAQNIAEAIRARGAA